MMLKIFEIFNAVYCWFRGGEESVQQGVQEQLDEGEKDELHLTCYICGEDVAEKMYARHLIQLHDSKDGDVSPIVMIRMQHIAQQFIAYWKHECYCFGAYTETKFMINMCHTLLKKHDNALDVLCEKIHQGGDVRGSSLFKLSQSVFGGRPNWGRLMAIFAFAVKLIRYYGQHKELQNQHLLSHWLTHVLIQYDMRGL